jgi:hypothetical protein
MGNMNQLDSCLAGLQTASRALTAVADNLAALFGGNTQSEAVTDGSSALEDDATTSITKEQVQAVLAEKARIGHTAAIQALLRKHSVLRVSDLDPTNYATVLAEAEGWE